MAQSTPNSNGGDTFGNKGINPYAFYTGIDLGDTKNNPEGILISKGKYSHAEGDNTTASGYASHAEGINSTASGAACHAEGRETLATFRDSHAEGYNTKALGMAAHAEGGDTLADKGYSHAEGLRTYALGNVSHAEGCATQASGNGSHAEGWFTVADKEGSHIMGKFGDSPEAFSWSLANGSDEEHKGIAAKILQKGEAFIDVGWYSGGADFAESFEWLDGNPDNEERIGYFVTLDGDKIKKATSGDGYILGVISAAPAVIGDAGELRWTGKYITDEWGRIQYQNVTIPERTASLISCKDGHGKDITMVPENTETQPVINPKWDNKMEYVPRSKRKEWSIVGLIGKLLVHDDGTCKVNGYCKPNDNGVATDSNLGYRVMKRINENIVMILLR